MPTAPSNQPSAISAPTQPRLIRDDFYDTLAWASCSRATAFRLAASLARIQHADGALIRTLRMCMRDAAKTAVADARRAARHRAAHRYARAHAA